ncbi:pumilio homolog 24 [Rhodamnia argentea]|uniref:Pumilio homolog 24 n=1 Tax=Rhodamnia argentea TaxID=178133 RepID=A0A8B8PZ93_9MYRT|nr:pumilio homolog 24 [Rhodamnia argentea]XP_030540134.1 pumilio homolog 24 [Rhodamnia argentea]
MAIENQVNRKVKKRKHGKEDSEALASKKAKPVSSKSMPQGVDKSRLQKQRKQLNYRKSDAGNEKKQPPLTKKERRLHAKELAEARKQKRKRYYTLEQELAHLWEKMRQHDIAKEDRSRLVTEALQKMKGKISEIAGSHVSSRVLQTCIKYCSQAERDKVFGELQPHLLNLACNTYAVHLVKKLLDSASKTQLAAFISSLHGHVASHLRHMVGSVVIEHVYQLANATQKQALLMELYSTELQLFKDLVSMKESRLVDVISKLGLQKSSVLRHMSSVIQPILEKGIVDHSIIHRMLVEYFSIADKSSARDVLQQLSGPLLVRMIHTRDGSQIGMLCIKHGSAKERKKIIKGMKGHIGKIAHDQYGSLVLVCIVSVVDDTKLVTKIIMRELQTILKELVLDKNGRRPLLQLLHTNCSRYLSPSDFASLNSSIPSLCSKDASEADSIAELGDVNELVEGKADMEMAVAEEQDEDGIPDVVDHLINGGKKDPLIRRRELLVNSGLAESLVDVCIENVGELIASNFGKEVIYEVATGGADGILHPTLEDKLKSLHESIAALVAQPKSADTKEEHVLQNFHSSRTIRKLVMDCPPFAVTLWEKALKGRCRTWAQGHSSKVITAFLESSDSMVCELAKEELQPLIDEAIIKQPKVKTVKQ